MYATGNCSANHCCVQLVWRARNKYWCTPFHILVDILLESNNYLVFPWVSNFFSVLLGP